VLVYIYMTINTFKKKNVKCKKKTKKNTQKRKGGQGSPLNPNKFKDTNSNKKSNKGKSIKKERDNKSLYYKLQKHLGKYAFLKEKRSQQIAAQLDSFNSGSAKSNKSSSVKRKSI